MLEVFNESGSMMVILKFKLGKLSMFDVAHDGLMFTPSTFVVIFCDNLRRNWVKKKDLRCAEDTW